MSGKGGTISEDMARSSRTRHTLTNGHRPFRISHQGRLGGFCQRLDSCPRFLTRSIPSFIAAPAVGVVQSDGDVADQSHKTPMAHRLGRKCLDSYLP